MKPTPQQKHLAAGGTLLRTATDEGNPAIEQRLNETEWHHRLSFPSEEIRDKNLNYLVTNHPQYFMKDGN